MARTIKNTTASVRANRHCACATYSFLYRLSYSSLSDNPNNIYGIFHSRMIHCTLKTTSLQTFLKVRDMLVVRLDTMTRGVEDSTPKIYQSLPPWKSFEEWDIE